MRTIPGRKSRLRSLVSTTAAALLVAGAGLIGLAAPASAAGASVSLSQQNDLDPDGTTITVNGSGFTPTAPAQGVFGVYVGIGPESAGQQPDAWTNASYYAGVKWVSSIPADGTFSQELTAITAQFISNGTPVDCTIVKCGIYTFAAHGSTDRTQDTYTPVTFKSAPADPEETSTTLTADPATESSVGTSVTLTATVTPAAEGSVEFFADAATLGSVPASSGTASLAVDSLAVGAHSLTATFTPTDATAFSGSTSAAVNHTVVGADDPDPVDPDPTDPDPVDPDPADPAGPAVGLSASSGLNPEGATIDATGTGFTPTASGAPGVYIGLGPKSAKDNADWSTNASYYTAVQWVRTIAADGTFVQTLTNLKAQFTSNGSAVDCLVVECGIYTFAAHGSPDRTQDTYTPVSFATTGTPPATPDPDPNPAGMSPVISFAKGLNPDGSATEGAKLGITGQFFVAGENVEIWLHSTPVQLGTATIAADGTLNAQVTLPAGITGAHSIQVVSSAGVTSLPITITAVDPGEVCVARSVSAATLSWGVKASFRAYISGGIANGSWNLSGVGYDSGSFVWSSGSGSFNPDLKMGVVSYPGSVNFTGHDGVLNLTLSNVRIQVNSSSSATILANVVSSDMNGVSSTHNGIAFATVSLGGASATGSSYSVSGAPATLTSAGAQAFAGFYEAGTALDPVSFTFPLGGETACTTATGAGLAGGKGSLASTGLVHAQTELAWAMVLISGGVALAWAGRRRSKASA